MKKNNYSCHSRESGNPGEFQIAFGSRVMSGLTGMKIFLILFLFLININFSFAKIEDAYVLYVIDGDTIGVSINGTEQRVRLLGIDAPEVANEEKGIIDEYFAREATNYLTQEVLNKNILLEPDKISDDKDRYGRLLRYVYIDGKDINANLIKDGYARIYLVFPFDKQEEYKQLSDVAEKNQLGLHNFDMRTIFLSDKNFTVEYFVGLFLFLFIFVLLVYLFKKNKVK